MKARSIATITGTNLEDTIIGMVGSDVIDAGAGNDTVTDITGGLLFDLERVNLFRQILNHPQVVPM